MAFKKFLTLIVILFLSHDILANHVEKRLSQITKKISSIKTDINKAKIKKSHLEESLDATETAASRLSMKLRDTREQLISQKKKLNQLEKQQATLERKLAEQQSSLAFEIKTLYLLGRQPNLKSLLSHEQADKSHRMTVYYHYISTQHIQIIAAIKKNLQDIQTNQFAIMEQFKVLKHLKQVEQSAQNGLKRERKRRYWLIKKMKNRIKNKGQQLRQLIANKHQLEKVLRYLQKQKRYQAALSQHFTHLRGKLNWPTKGVIENYFGTKIDQSELRWNGILIKAPEEQPVHAVASGIVIFAKWMPGYGLLMIINHGHGYMTLYGRNHTLVKKTGDIIHAGDIIATVGETGGYQMPALYFAIRHNAKPLNPTAWCRPYANTSKKQKSLNGMI